MNGRGGPIDVLPRGAAAAGEEEEKDQTARAVLTEDGFEPDDLNKRDRRGRTPMIYYSGRGNVTMARYLIARGADCRKTDAEGCSPMLMAAYYGHVEIIKLLSQIGGAHEDIRRVVTKYGYSPLGAAQYRDYFRVVYWLLLNGELWSPHDGWFPCWQGRNDGGIVHERGRGFWFDDNGSINDATMRKDLSPTYSNGQSRQWGFDKRETVLAWAKYIVTNHDTVVTLLLTGMIVRSNQTASSLVVFNGTSGILELIAHYAAGTPQQVRTPRQLLVLLPAFIDDTPFVEVEDEEVEEDE